MRYLIVLEFVFVLCYKYVRRVERMDYHFAEDIKAIREMLGMTQAGLAAEIGMQSDRKTEQRMVLCPVHRAGGCRPAGLDRVDEL